MNFIVTECGNDADEAFQRAKNNIGVYGGQPETGILLMDDFIVMNTYPENIDPMKFVQTLCEKIDMVPGKTCQCVNAGKGEYIFFGKPLA